MLFENSNLSTIFVLIAIYIMYQVVDFFCFGVSHYIETFDLILHGILKATPSPISLYYIDANENQAPINLIFIIIILTKLNGLPSQDRLYSSKYHLANTTTGCLLHGVPICELLLDL